MYCKGGRVRFELATVMLRVLNQRGLTRGRYFKRGEGVGFGSGNVL